MKINYFVLYPNNTYEFVEKDVDFILNDIETTVINDMARFDSCVDYPGYFIANNECQTDYTNVNKLASKFLNDEVYDVCAIVKSFEYWPSENSDFETFNEDDRKEFELILNEQIKVINNENH